MRVLEDIVRRLGLGKRPPVRATVNGDTYRSTIAPVGGRLMLSVSADLRAGAGIQAGDALEVALVLGRARGARSATHGTVRPPPPSPPPDPERSTDLSFVAGPVARAGDIRTLCERLHAIISTSDAAVVVCDVRALPATARSVEALARLQLTARRLNGTIQLQRASPVLRDLLDFAGLADILPTTTVRGGS